MVRLGIWIQNQMSIWYNYKKQSSSNYQQDGQDGCHGELSDLREGTAISFGHSFGLPCGEGMNFGHIASSFRIWGCDGNKIPCPGS